MGIVLQIGTTLQVMDAEASFYNASCSTAHAHGQYMYQTAKYNVVASTMSCIYFSKLNFSMKNSGLYITKDTLLNNSHLQW